VRRSDQLHPYSETVGPDRNGLDPCCIAAPVLSYCFTVQMELIGRAVLNWTPPKPDDMQARRKCTGDVTFHGLQGAHLRGPTPTLRPRDSPRSKNNSRLSSALGPHTLGSLGMATTPVTYSTYSVARRFPQVRYGTVRYVELVQNPTIETTCVTELLAGGRALVECLEQNERRCAPLRRSAT
jgi:hypothetical protein